MLDRLHRPRRNLYGPVWRECVRNGNFITHFVNCQYVFIGFSLTFYAYYDRMILSYFKENVYEKIHLQPDRS